MVEREELKECVQELKKIYELGKTNGRISMFNELIDTYDHAININEYFYLMEGYLLDKRNKLHKDLLNIYNKAFTDEEFFNEIGMEIK